MSKEFISQLAEEIANRLNSFNKPFLSTDEAAAFIGVSRSTLYKLTSGQQIPHFKPTGKLCYFSRQDLEEWLQSNRVSTLSEIAAEADKYCNNKPYGMKAKGGKL